MARWQKWKEKHPEEAKAYKKAWRKGNKEQVRLYERRMRLRKTLARLRPDYNKAFLEEQVDRAIPLRPEPTTWQEALKRMP